MRMSSDPAPARKKSGKKPPARPNRTPPRSPALQVTPAPTKDGGMSEPFGPYRVILTLAARNQSRIDLVENILVQNGDGLNRREVLKRILIVPGKEDNRELIDAEEQ